MAGLFQNRPFILIGFALILASSFLIIQSEILTVPILNTPYGIFALNIPMKKDSHDSRRATFYWDDHFSMDVNYWCNIGRGENEIKPTGTFSAETATLRNVSLKYPITISGHKIRNVVLTSSGYIDAHDYNYTWIVSPMTLNTNGRPSIIKYLNIAGGVLVVQWEIWPFYYEDRYQDEVIKMQVQVYSDGKVVFIYKKIPFGSLWKFRERFNDFYKQEFGFIFIDMIPHGHQVDLSILFPFNEVDVEENLVMIFTALPFCPNFRTCKSCSGAKIVVEGTGETIPCVWCPGIERCSSKKDINNYYHQAYWLRYCENQEISNPSHCPGEERGPAERADKKTEETVADEL
ncbi:Hypothetical predicted protein [Cloeon dipterum]|uniref:Uncharacterized protein n=1 Tax=Cloeon dipterum TaxID=197152 RepID=A0A8S1E1H3_9INSE|nr:Hypothetical predicted protein [Cloeon dipterum]